MGAFGGSRKKRPPKYLFWRKANASKDNPPGAIADQRRGYAAAKKYGLPTEWIMTGEGPKRLGDTPAQPGQEEKNTGIIEEWVQEVRKKGGNDGRIVMELSLQVPEFREWHKEKKSKSGKTEVGPFHEGVA